MRKFITIMFLLVVSLFAFGNNAPPGFVPDDDATVVIPATDQSFQADLQAAEINVYSMYEVEKAAPVVQAPVYGYTVLIVPEVTACRKISLNSLVVYSSDLLSDSKSSVDTSMHRRIQRPNYCYIQNLQNSNFGYPLTAN